MPLKRRDYTPGGSAAYHHDVERLLLLHHGCVMLPSAVPHEALPVLAATVGLRQGELLGLLLQQVDLT